jgi:hypothetical protein
MLFIHLLCLGGSVICNLIDGYYEGMRAWFLSHLLNHEVWIHLVYECFNDDNMPKTVMHGRIKVISWIWWRLHACRTYGLIVSFSNDFFPKMQRY